MNDREEDRLSRVERMSLRMSVIQTFLAVTGFIVAIIALYAALNESDAVRKQQQASVWPNLEFHRSFRSVPGSEKLEVKIKNSGIGPAKIETIALSLDGKPIREWDQLVRAFTEIENPLFSEEQVSRRVLAPGDEFSVFAVTARELTSETVTALREALDTARIRGQICYCSVFQDCWHLLSTSRDPDRVKQCPAPSPENKL